VTKVKAKCFIAIQHASFPVIPVFSFYPAAAPRMTGSHNDADRNTPGALPMAPAIYVFVFTATTLVSAARQADSPPIILLPA
jgi:hypothetical protein